MFQRAKPFGSEHTLEPLSNSKIKLRHTGTLLANGKVPVFKERFLRAQNGQQHAQERFLLGPYATTDSAHMSALNHLPDAAVNTRVSSLSPAGLFSHRHTDIQTYRHTGVLSFTWLLPERKLDVIQACVSYRWAEICPLFDALLQVCWFPPRYQVSLHCWSSVFRTGRTL